VTVLAAGCGSGAGSVGAVLCEGAAVVVGLRASGEELAFFESPPQPAVRRTLTNATITSPIALPTIDPLPTLQTIKIA
jgi:hypothetical protein